jgi:hypothetical protein
VTVLRRGYVPVEPDPDGFDRKLITELAKQDPGGKAGKQIGGQLNRALKRLDLAPIDVKADPKKAFAAIEATEEKLRRLSRDSATVEVKVQTERALSQLGRFKKQLGDIGGAEGERAATGFAARFGARIGPLIANVAASPPVAVGGALLGAAMAPTLAAGISAAIVGGAGIGGVIGGLTLAARDEQVKQAGKELGAFVLTDLTQKSAQFVPATLAGIQRVKQGFLEIGPDLDRIFASSRFVEPLVDGAVKGAKGFVSGFADAVDKADPVIEALRYGIEEVGVQSGKTFSLLASDAKEGASAVDDLTGAVSKLITVTGGIIHGIAAVKGWTDQLDVAIDRSRYWIEENSAIAKALDKFGVNLDLTADGFKAGSVEADAYRKATLGTATAADFATLKTAGMSDAQIAAADASGTYRAQLAQVTKETLKAAVAAGTLVASEDDVKTAQQAASGAQEDYNRTLDAMAPAAGKAAQYADGLRKATQNLYGAQISATDANEAYEASWDSLSAAIGKNGRTLNVHSAAGRANRDALESVASASKDMYFADVQAGVGIAAATRKHNTRIAALKEEARRSGLDKTETQKLINTYGAIPKKKQTDLVVQGVNRVVQALKDLYVFQRSLADGIPINSEIAKLKGEKGPAKRYGGYADGGQIGGWSPHSRADNIPAMLTAKEWVHPVDAVDYYGPQIMGAIQKRQVPREVLAGFAAGQLGKMGDLPFFAAGGQVAPVDTSRRWPFTATLAHTRIPSRAQVAAKVPVGAGPAGAFLRAQNGKPYVWASAGPNGYDCSGIVSAVYNILHGRSPYSHTFSTGSLPGRWFTKPGIGGQLTAAWSHPGQSPASSSTGHMMGMVGGLTFESTGSRGVHLGASTRRLTDFAHIAHYSRGGQVPFGSYDSGGYLPPGLSLAHNGTGRPEPVGVVAGDTYNITVNVPVGAHPAEVGRQTVLAIQSFERANGSRWRSGS